MTCILRLFTNTQGRIQIVTNLTRVMTYTTQPSTAPHLSANSIGVYVVMDEVPFSIAMDYHYRRDITSTDSEEIASGSSGTRRSCKVSILKCAANIVKFCNIFTSDTRSNDKIVAKFYNIIKDKKFKKVGRTYNFPRATSRGHGSGTQACMPMTDYY